MACIWVVHSESCDLNINDGFKSQESIYLLYISAIIYLFSWRQNTHIAVQGCRNEDNFQDSIFLLFHHWILRIECRLQGLATGTAIFSYHKVVVALRTCFSKAAETWPVSMEQEIQKKKKNAVLLASFPYTGCFPHTPFCHDAIL